MKYKTYDDAVSAIAEELKSRKPCQWIPYSFLRGSKLFRQHLEQNNQPYSLLELKIWLEKNKLEWKYNIYKTIRHALLLIAQQLEPGVEVKQLLYKNRPAYQQLPTWAISGLEEFHASSRYQAPDGLATYDADRRRISSFLLQLSRGGIQSFYTKTESWTGGSEKIRKELIWSTLGGH